MNMNFRRMSDNNIADMAVNIATLLAGTELSAIDSTIRTALIAALGTLPSDLQGQTFTAEVLEAERTAAVSQKNAAHAGIEAWMMQVRNYLESGLASDNQYALCGFNIPVPPVRMYVAMDPADLSVTGYSYGANKCVFRGNNKYAHVMYEVWRREAGGEWGVLASTKKQSFTDTPVKPGKFYQYKVRAVATKNASNFSDPAVVYPGGE